MTLCLTKRPLSAWYNEVSMAPSASSHFACRFFSTFLLAPLLLKSKSRQVRKIIAISLYFLETFDSTTPGKKRTAMFSFEVLQIVAVLSFL
jgi:hypothetical protein